MQFGGGLPLDKSQLAPPTGIPVGIPTTAPPTGASFATHPFQYLQECYDANSPNFRFRFFFYNVVPGGVAANPPTKAVYVSDRLWKQATSDNPDPERMVPVLANGFFDLQARRSWQEEVVAAQRAKLQEIDQRLTLLLTRQDLDTSTQIQVIQKQQLRLTLRTMQLMRRVEVMRRAGSKISPTEQELLRRIQELVQRLQRPPLNSHSVRSCEAHLEALAEADRLDPLASIRHCQLTDQESLQALHHVLQQQQKGLLALVETLTKDLRDLETMRYGYQSL